VTTTGILIDFDTGSTTVVTLSTNGAAISILDVRHGQWDAPAIRRNIADVCTGFEPDGFVVETDRERDFIDSLIDGISVVVSPERL
jgi:hypothetical protein